MFKGVASRALGVFALFTVVCGLGYTLVVTGIAQVAFPYQANGSLTTFSVANDVAKYFAIIPALFSPIYPGLGALNILGLAGPLSAVLSAIIYNALVIVALIPAALKGVKYREVPSGQLLTHNLLVWGLGGIVAPFVFIKLIDMLLSFCGIM